MTKKDYIIIANEIANMMRIEKEIEAEGNDTSVSQISLSVLAQKLACKMALDNPRFDKYKFLEACGTLNK